MDIRQILAVNLRKLRQAKHLSQEELAHRARIDRTYISSLERSVYSASIDVVERIARVLGVEAADLLRKGAARKHGKDSDNYSNEHSRVLGAIRKSRARQ